MDVLVGNNGEAPLLLRNNAGKGNHWLGLRLEGSACNRDAIGALVGQDRGGLPDEDYRRFVRARITVNRSRGLVNELVLVTQLVLDDPAVTIQITPSFPAALVERIIGAEISDDAASVLASFLRRTVAAGVRLLVEFQNASDAETFAFLDADAGLGFGDATDPAVGGIFASVTE